MGKGRSCSKRMGLLLICTWSVCINFTNILWVLDNKDFQEDDVLDQKSFFQQPEVHSLSSSALKIRYDDEQDVSRKLYDDGQEVSARRVVNLSNLNVDFGSIPDGKNARDENDFVKPVPTTPLDEPTTPPDEECKPITRNIKRGSTTIIYDLDCMDEEWEESCEPVTMTSGHTDRVSIFRPTCNSFHELDLVHAYKPLDGEGYRMEALGQGSYRSAFKLSPASLNNSTDDRFESEEMLLKLFGGTKDWQRMSKSFMQLSQLDAFAMEALSSSKYVADIFGFCGSDVMTEIANETGYSIFEDNSFSTTDRLLIARDLARGLADLHTLVPNAWGLHNMDTSHQLVFAHHDVKPENIIRSRNGQIRWNDFNLGLINRKYMDQNSSIIECPVEMGGNKWGGHDFLIRAPEELGDRAEAFFFVDAEGNGRNTASQAADVYAFGNILFTLLTQQDPWTFNGKFKDDSQRRWYVIREKTLGYLPILPERYLEESGAKPLWEAIQMCYTLDPRGRPTAMELANFLERAHAKLLSTAKIE